MAQQTAVDWLVNKIYMVIPNEERNFLEGLREQAKAIEKEQREEVIELPSDEEVINKFNTFISTEVSLKFLTKEQGERLKWYYETYLVNEIQGGNNGHI